MDECRCVVCGCCRHAHNGWRHEWSPTPDGELPGTRQIAARVEREEK